MTTDGSQSLKEAYYARKKARLAAETQVTPAISQPENIISLYKEGLPIVPFDQFATVIVKQNNGIDIEAQLTPDRMLVKDMQKIGDVKDDLSVWFNDKQVGYVEPQRQEIQAELRPDKSVWYGAKQIGSVEGEEFILSKEEQEDYEPIDLGMPVLQEALNALSSLDEFVGKPFAAAVTAPFRGDLEVVPESSFERAGVLTPVERGILSVLPGGPERERYEEWDAPWGVKGALEFIPWLGMGGGPTKTAMQRLFGKVSKIESKQVAGKVINEAEKQVLSKAAQVESTFSQSLKGGLIDIQDATTVIELTNKPDIARGIANLPGIKQISRHLNPSAVANTPAEKAMVARQVMRAQGNQRTQITMSQLWKAGNQEKIFGKLDKSGLIKEGSLKGLAVNDIRTYPERYAGKLTTEQKNWIKKASEIEKAKLQYLKDNGIEIKELTFDEGGEYAGRKVYGKIINGEVAETVSVGAGVGRIGKKAGFEKVRSFKTAEEAIKEGYQYIPDDEALMYNVQAAYNRVADKRTADWLLGQVEWRTTGAPEELILAAESAKFKYDRSKLLLAALNRAVRGERVPDATIGSIARAYPTEAQSLREIIQLIQGKKLLATKPASIVKPKRLTSLEQVDVSFDIVKEELTKRTGMPSNIIDGILYKVYHFPEKIDTLYKTPISKGNRELSAKLLYESLPLRFSDASMVEGTKGDLLFHIGRWKSGGIDPDIYMGSMSPLTDAGKAAYKKEVFNLVNEVHNIVKASLPTAKQVRARFLETVIPKAEAGMPLVKPATSVKSLRLKAKELIKTDKLESLTAVSQRARAREKALQVGFAETMVSQPAFGGKIFTGPEAKEIAETISKSMDAKVSKALTQVNKVNAVSRYFKLAGDISPMAIQLLFLAGENPKIYGKAFGGFVRAMFDTEFHSGYIAKNAQLLARHPDIILARSGNEFTEALAKGGLLRMKPFSTAGKALEPFQRGFEASMDVAGIELAKSMEHLAVTNIERASLAAFINEFRGIASSARLGVSPRMRAIETATLLAPRYNRAIAALLFDAARGAVTLGQGGGLRSRLAIQGLTKGIGALSAMAVAVSYALGEDEEEIWEHFDPTSSRFFTWNIGGVNIGPGSKVRSIVKLVAQSWDNPEALLQNGMDNPSLRFLRGNLAPVLGSAVDIWTGRNYIGDPVRENAMQFSKEVLISNLLPIWIENVLYEGGSINQRAIRGAGEFFGGRTYNETTSEIASRLRDKYSQQDYGIKYEDIDNQKQRDDLRRKHEDLDKLQKLVSEEYAERGNKEEQYYYTTKVAIQEARAEAWNKFAQAFIEGKITNEQYTDNIHNVKLIYATSNDVLWNAREELDEYNIKQLEKWIEENQSPKDRALSEYYDVRGQVLEQMLPIDWDYANAYIDEYMKQRYPEEDIQKYVTENKDDWLNDLPELPRKIETMRYADRESLSKSGFYNLPTVAEQRDQGLTGKQVIDYRAAFREQNPEVDAMLNFWYDYYAGVKTQEAMSILVNKAAELSRDYSNIPALQEEQIVQTIPTYKYADRLSQK